MNKIDQKISSLPTEYLITMPNGDEWSVPVMAIAEHRAKHLAHKFGGNVRLSYKGDTKPHFLADKKNIEIWARTMMHWDDVKKIAIFIGNRKESDQAGWVSGPCEIK